MSIDISPAAEAAREGSRDARGRFGAQPADESDCQLGALARDGFRSAAITVLADFDPRTPGRSNTPPAELLLSHSVMNRGCSPMASDTERARALTTCVRGSLVDHGGLAPVDYDTIMCGVLPDRQPEVLALAANHRGADEHLQDVRAGTALPGDHPQDAETLSSYRRHLGIHTPDRHDSTGQISELTLAWSYRLDREALELARHTSRA